MTFRDKPCGYAFTDTPCGRVKGIRKDGYCLYKGIRYATAERWEEPVLVERWEGEYDATIYGPSCCQQNGFYPVDPTTFSAFYYNQPADKEVVAYSEDCLNLNIWVPERAEKAPVALFIHGGSFVTGGNSAANISNGKDYCKRGIILVTINYRLNAFATGYDHNHHGNYALKDQIAAIQWVKRNIAAFGGNPDRIVGIGESAGALSLQCLLYTPESRGLLAASIMMSGGGNLDTLGIPCQPVFTETVWKLVMKKYGAERLDQLKSLSARELYDAWSEAAATDADLLNNCAKPIVDGRMIPREPAALMASGQVYDIPCIMGMSSEDMYPHMLYTKIVEWGAYQSREGRSPVYAYYLDRQLPGGDNVGAYHGCDLWYAFGTLNRNWRPFTRIDYRISENFIDYFSTFIKTGAPGCEGLARWSPITADDPAFLHFGDDEPAMCYPPEDKFATAIQNTLKPFPGM